MTADWATVYADAATAAATLAAVIVALVIARADAVRRRRDKEREQAEHITGWMEESQVQVFDSERHVKLVLFNASNQLVYNLIASIVTAHGETHPGDEWEYRTFVGRLAPGRSEFDIKHPGHGMSKRYAVELAFNDAGERTWIRHGRGRLQQIDGDTLEHYGLSHPVGWLMP